MGIAEIILTASAVVALLTWLTFALSYNRVRWEKSPEGRNVMAVSTGLVLLISTVLINRVAQWEDFSYWSMALSLTLVAGAGIWRTFQLKNAQSHPANPFIKITEEEEENK